MKSVLLNIKIQTLILYNFLKQKKEVSSTYPLIIPNVKLYKDIQIPENVEIDKNSLSTLALNLFEKNVNIDFGTPIELNKEEEECELKLTIDWIHLTIPYDTLSIEQQSDRSQLMKRMRDSGHDITNINLNIINDNAIRKIELALLDVHLKRTLPTLQSRVASQFYRPTAVNLLRNKAFSS
jgi:hypothetical protein